VDAKAAGARAQARAGGRHHDAERGATRLAQTRFNLDYFEHVFLSKIELKCTK
jgi:hypothetical protein